MSDVPSPSSRRESWAVLAVASLFVVGVCWHRHDEALRRGQLALAGGVVGCLVVAAARALGERRYPAFGQRLGRLAGAGLYVLGAVGAWLVVDHAARAGDVSDAALFDAMAAVSGVIVGSGVGLRGVDGLFASRPPNG